MSTRSLQDFWAVIPAGGAGTRLWPLSRAGHPKFLLDLTGSGRTLIQSTVDRLSPLADDRLLVVTGAAHAASVEAQVSDALGSLGRIVAEPAPRDSMAAIGLAAALIESWDPDAIMGSFAADHHIPDAETFAETVTRAVDAARHGWLVTIGITPSFASTGFGYIRSDEVIAGTHAERVLEFVEKPSAAMASEYVRAGYRWNASMFICRPSVLLDLLAEQDPQFAAALRGIAAAPETLEEVWPTLPKIAFDYAVAEPAAALGRVAMVPGPFGWDDIGDFASLADLLDGDLDGRANGLTVLGDAEIQALEASGLVVSSGRTVAVVGIDEVVVVDTPDALLVTTRAHAQRVKDIVGLLKDQGRSELI